MQRRTQSTKQRSLALEPGRLWTDWPKQLFAAADAVMFSDEAIECAAWALYKRAYPEHSAESFDQVGGPIRESYVKQAAIVVASLRGEQP
ncbi:hypothetical protein [Paenarthrobacter nitroguajacolicus]|uniref:hypothetical protein n=1 Tax=Paenarthrobacter nitroguajacolicus TaxID=211146 RepID=UPI0015BA534E|nr:hypothetical protein [Paenarthrobacter nitroguajacolicus]NWL34469.1 hypothetical protein [Paenarthrobacter nitroguajacolicus]